MHIAEHEKIARQIQIEIYRKMSPQKKLEIASGLYETAWELKKAALKQKHPEKSDLEIHNMVKEIFLYATS